MPGRKSEEADNDDNDDPRLQPSSSLKKREQQHRYPKKIQVTCTCVNEKKTFYMYADVLMGVDSRSDDNKDVPLLDYNLDRRDDRQECKY